MRTLERNKQSIYYANYSGVTEIVDENGFYTGETTISYTEPTQIKVNVSAARGEASVDLFGTDLNYTKTIVSDKDLGIDEHSILWIGKPNTEPHNYVVVSIAKSINYITYAIREVDVSAEDKS